MFKPYTCYQCNQPVRTPAEENQTCPWASAHIKSTSRINPEGHTRKEKQP